MNKTLLASFLLSIAFSCSYSFVAPTKRRRSMTICYEHLSFNPLRDYRSIDWDRARECAENFGQCSLEELEDLRNNLHKERLQHFAVVSSSPTSGSDWEHQLIEEEIDLQLGLLKDHIGSSPSMLFPQVEEPMVELPHLKDSSLKEKAKHVLQKANKDLAYEETILDEGIIETIMMCIAVAALTLAPQILHR